MVAYFLDVRCAHCCCRVLVQHRLDDVDDCERVADKDWTLPKVLVMREGFRINIAVSGRVQGACCMHRGRVETI